MSARAKTVEALCELLTTGDEVDRCYAARALGVLGDPAAADDLQQRLRDEDVDVCVDAADALGRIGAQSAIDPLVESLKNDSSGEICAAAVRALGNLGGEKVAQALRKVAHERPEAMEWDDDWDTWWDVQLEAVKALGRFADEQAIDILVDVLTDESQQDIENEILRALASIGGRGTDVLIARLQDTGSLPLHRRRAARALGGASENNGIPPVLGRALQDEAPEVRAEAATALAAQGAAQYARGLLLMRRDPAEEVRKAAIKAVISLSEQGIADAGLSDELTAMLDDPSSGVRASVYNILGHTVESNPLAPEVIAKVAADLENPEAETASAACTLLGKNGDTVAVDVLLPVLNDTQAHPMVRREAALMIGQLGLFNQPVADSLSRAAADPAQAVRLAALSALARLETQGVIEGELQPFKSPMEAVIAAIEGKFSPEKPDTEEAAPPNQPPAEAGSDTSGVEPEAGSTPPEDGASSPEQQSAPENDPDENTDDIKLPDSPARIVREGDVRSAGSTLDAIAMDNVEAALGLDAAGEPAEHDEETQEFLAVADANKETMSRIRSERKIDPAFDVRRLGIRVLGDCDRTEAVHTLIGYLQDNDARLRREATESIGQVALRNPDNPALMDAVGILITQLAIGDQDQRRASARTLGRLGNRAALVPLVETLKDPVPNVRIQALESLSRLVTQGADPEAADHMVVRNVPPLSVARSIAESLKDEEMAVRVAAARELPVVLGSLEEQSFTAKVVGEIIDSVFGWTGEEARLIGRSLRGFDASLTTDKLLVRLKEAGDSTKRSVVIEMIEETFSQAAEDSHRAA